MNEDTLLYRQVHPKWIQNDNISSQTFIPTKKDAGLLSAYDGDLIMPEAAWQHYTRTLGLESAGVVAVAVAECQAQLLSVKSSPARFPEHTVIEFSGLGRSAIERKADQLKLAAFARGWQYRPPPAGRAP